MLRDLDVKAFLKKKKNYGSESDVFAFGFGFCNKILFIHITLFSRACQRPERTHTPRLVCFVTLYDYLGPVGAVADAELLHSHSDHSLTRVRDQSGHQCCGSETIFFGSGSHFRPSFRSGFGSGSFLTSKMLWIQFRIRP
jgi:hypothetical protein